MRNRPPSEPATWASPRAAARLAGVPEKAIVEAIRRGRIRAELRREGVRVCVEDVDRLAEERGRPC